MPITEVTQYRTTNGTVYSSLESAKDAEAFEQIVEPFMSYYDYEGEAFDSEGFLTFLKTDAEAVAFVEAINEVFAKNPHNGFKPAPNQEVM